MTLRGVLVAVGLVVGVGWLWGRKGAAAAPIQQQLASIWGVFVDAWVRRAGNPLVYTKDGVFQEFVEIQVGETVWIQVTAPVTLAFGAIHQNLVPDGNVNAVVWNP